jgi:hypothetical protein
VQADARVDIEYDPGGHAWHALLAESAPVTPAITRVPAGHGLHAATAAAVEYFPFAQSSQASLEDLAPTKPGRTWVPAGQVLHSANAGTSEKRPTGQLEQPTAPSGRVLKVPSTQGFACVFLLGQWNPGGQTTHLDPKG